MQTQSQSNPIYKSSVDCLKSIIGNHGLKGLYKGATATVLRESVAYGTYFSVYALMMERMLKPGQTTRDLGLGSVFAAGSISGILLWVASFPLDVLKTKMQTDHFIRPVYRNTLDCTVQTYKGLGLGGFFKGFMPCIVRSVPANGGTFVVFEMASRAIKGNKSHWGRIFKSELWSRIISLI